MNIIVTCVLFILALVKKKSHILCLLLFLLMWSLWGWNTWNGDYIAYENRYYDSVNTSNTQEFGFLLINCLFVWLGIPFQTYMIIFSYVVLFILYKLIIKNNPLPAFVSAIYFLLFIQEFVFMRNYLTNTLMLYGLFAIINERKYCYKKFFALAVLSFSIHTTAILFLFFLPFLNEKKYSFGKIFLLNILLVAFMIFLVYPNLLPLLNSFFQEKMNYYSPEENSITNSSYFQLLLVLSILIEHKYVVSKIDSRLTHRQQRMYSIIRNFNIMSLFYISIYYLAPYFASRFLRFLFTVNLFYTTSVCFYAYKALSFKWQFLSLMSFLLLIISILLFLYISTLPFTVIPLYKCNLIWGNDFYEPIMQ